MKMIYIANVRIPTEKAHGRQIMEMCGAFACLDPAKLGRSSQEVGLTLIVAKRNNPQFESVDVFEYYGIKNKFSIWRVWNIDLTAWQMNRIWGRFGTMVQGFSFALTTFCETVLSEEDVIYSRDPHPLFFLSFFKNNLVYEMHKMPNSFLWAHKFLFRRVKKIVVITENIKKALVEKFAIEGDKILVAPDGVDIEKFDIASPCHSSVRVSPEALAEAQGGNPENIETKGTGFRVKLGMTEQEFWRENLDLPQNKKIILYSGHLYSWKGVYTLADAAQFLPNDYLVVFVGGMEYDLKKVRQYTEDKGFKNINFLGHQDAEKIPQYLKAADVLVLPNSGKKEVSRMYTSPMKMFEYMAARRPIVVSDLPSLREVLDENTAYLFEADNARDLAEKIKNALQNREKTDKIVQDAFAKAQEYSWIKRAEKILQELRVTN